MALGDFELAATPTQERRFRRHVENSFVDHAASS